MARKYEDDIESGNGAVMQDGKAYRVEYMGGANGNGEYHVFQSRGDCWYRVGTVYAGNKESAVRKEVAKMVERREQADAYADGDDYAD